MRHAWTMLRTILAGVVVAIVLGVCGLVEDSTIRNDDLKHLEKEVTTINLTINRMDTRLGAIEQDIAATRAEISWIRDRLDTKEVYLRLAPPRLIPECLLVGIRYLVRYRYGEGFKDWVCEVYRLWANGQQHLRSRVSFGISAGRCRLICARRLSANVMVKCRESKATRTKSRRLDVAVGKTTRPQTPAVREIP